MMKKVLTVLLILIPSLFVLCGCTREERLARQENYETLGRNKMDEGDYEGAVRDFDAALGECLGRIGNKEIEINLYKAAALFMSGDAESSLETYSALIDYEKTDPKPYYLRGSVYLKQGEHDLAVADYKAAVALTDSDYEMYIQSYENLSAAGLENEALSFLNSALALSEKSPQSYLERGRIYLILEQYDLAQDQLITARDKGISDAAVYLAQVYQTTGATESAQQVLEEYISEGNASCVAMNVMAQLAMENEDYSSALSYINRGLEMDEVTNQQSLMRNKIICQEKTSDFDGAYQTAKVYTQTYPKDEEAARELVFLSTRYTGAVDSYYEEKNALENEEDEEGEDDDGADEDGSGDDFEN